VVCLLAGVNLIVDPFETVQLFIECSPSLLSSASMSFTFTQDPISTTQTETTPITPDQITTIQTQTTIPLTTPDQITTIQTHDNTTDHTRSDNNTNPEDNTTNTNSGKQKLIKSKIKVICQLCEQEIDKPLMDQHTFFCTLIQNCDASPQSCDIRLHRLIDAIAPRNFCSHKVRGEFKK